MSAKRISDWLGWRGVPVDGNERAALMSCCLKCRRVRLGPGRCSACGGERIAPLEDARFHAPAPILSRAWDHLRDAMFGPLDPSVKRPFLDGDCLPRRRGRMVPIVRGPALPPFSAESFRGRVRALDEHERSLVDGRPCLLSQLRVRPDAEGPHGLIFFDVVRAVRFEVERDGGQPLRIEGESELRAPPRFVARAEARRDLLAAVGVPASIDVRGIIEEACICDGDEVDVWGEPRNELARTDSYRGVAEVVRLVGEVARPVLVVRRGGRSSDPR